MKDSFIFYRSFFEAIKDLDDKKRLKMFDSIAKLALENEETDDLNGVCKQLFILIKPQILANEQKREQYLKDVENGKKGAVFGSLGGRPKKNKEDFKTPPKTPGGFLKITPPQNPINVNENVNENVNVKCEATNTHTQDEVFSNLDEWFGEYKNVHLTKRQYGLLLNEILDKNKLNEVIGELSENIACNTGKAPPYDDKSPDMHFAILRKYWRYRKLNGGTRPQTQSDKAKAFKDELDKLTEQYRLKEANSG
ncbi:hypothetical protein IKE67_08915 [bacterium]|nr:hypothetical protein [bacterium]